MKNTPSRRTSKSPSLKFDQRLILNQWMLKLFEVESLDKLAADLKDPIYERFSEDNQTQYFQILQLRLWEREKLSNDILRRYDENIVRHWRKITEKRNRQGHILYPKYFQYLSLLFTEVYLDRYFSNAYQLVSDLNRQVEEFNRHTPKADQAVPYSLSDLRKIAFWNATGSGKTLLMHINILQYRHYLKQYGREQELNRVILLTPNEGLSNQHLGEFELSDINAVLFSKEEQGLFHTLQRPVEIIDIHKLGEDSGVKTIAADSFEDDNLVLVDEGHRGSSGIEWKARRDQICENGFSFEYSATFGQAMKASGKKDLIQEYAKCILFDYSYKYFYKDGYGKDYRILNLADDKDEEKRNLYLTACLLVFLQQQKLFQNKKNEFQPYLIENPLWVFVGGSVTKSTSQREVSDVMDIVLFLSNFVKNRQVYEDFLGRLLKQNSGLLDALNRDIFFNAFRYLDECNYTASALFDDILKTVFNSAASGVIHMENLKGAEGEIALRLGDNDPFGLINVGDPNKLCKLCEEHRELSVTDREFSGSMFLALNDAESKINILIGSKKFMEGWNSWRVSTMGLMNIGKKEGSQIIQLFGRGVRLKGYGFNLKRSRHVMGVNAPNYIEVMETLNIFGIRADYMQQFKEYLEEEGLPSNEDIGEYILPTVSNLYGKKLKILKLKDGVNFKKNGQKPTLEYPKEDDKFLKSPVVLDWYPKIQAQISGEAASKVVVEKETASLTQQHIAFMNLEEIYFELQDFKNERFWHNLNLSREKIWELLSTPRWYTLFIPTEELRLTSFLRVRRWQEIAVALLKKYCEKYYAYRKSEYESPFLELKELTANDPNFINEYRFLIEGSVSDIVKTLNDIKEAIKLNELKDIEFRGFFQSIGFGRHLYQPLIYCKSNLIQVKPVSLNEGERDFVNDLRKFFENHEEFFHDKELYLLRNQSRGRGIGFFEAGNFYPDFIVWLLVNEKQYINFIDPKGLRNLEGKDDPKIEFYKNIKTLENRIGDATVRLNSFIISNTAYHQIKFWDISQNDLENRNVLFQQDDKEAYINKLMKRALKN